MNFYKILGPSAGMICLFFLASYPATGAGDQFSDQVEPNWKELGQIVPPETEIGKAFDDYCRSLILSLDPNAKSNGLNNTSFYLSVDEKPQAYYQMQRFKWLGKTTTRHAIVLSLGELRGYSYEEDLIWTLGHEWFHRMVYHPNRPNSKAEEALADLSPLSALARLGYNPNQALLYVKKFFGSGRQADRKGNIAGEWILDAHPLDHHRIKLMSQGVGKLAFDYGGFDDTKPRQLPELIRSLQKANRYPLHISYIDQFLPPDKWTAATAEEKIEMLRRFLSHEHTDFNRRRYFDLKNLVKILMAQVEASENLKVARTLLFQFVQEDLLPRFTGESFSYEGAIFDELKKSSVFDSRTPEAFLYGPVVFELISLTKDFIDSKTRSAAIRAAEEIDSLLDNNTIPTGLAHAVWWADILPNFEFPNLDNFEARRRAARRGKAQLPRVPWNRHVQWSLDDESGLICKVLIILGVNDRRITDHYHFEELWHETDQLSRGPHSLSHYSGELVLTDSGRVKDILDAYGESALGPEPSYLKKARKIAFFARNDYAVQEHLISQLARMHQVIGDALKKHLHEDDRINSLKKLSYHQGGNLRVHEVIPRDYVTWLYKSNSENAPVLSNRDLFYQDPYAFTLAYDMAFTNLFLDIDRYSSHVVPEVLEKELASLFELIVSDPSKSHLKDFLRDFFLRKAPDNHGSAKNVLFPFMPGSQDYQMKKEEWYLLHRDISEMAPTTFSPLFHFLFSHYKSFLMPNELYKVAERWNLLKRDNIHSKMALHHFRQRHGYSPPSSEKEVLSLIEKFYNKKRNKNHFRGLAIKELYKWIQHRNEKQLSIHLVTKVIEVIGPSQMKEYPLLASEFRATVGKINVLPRLARANFLAI